MSARTLASGDESPPTRPGTPGFELHWFDLAEAEDRFLFARWREEWLRLLKVSYGAFNHRDDIHLDRVYRHGFRLLLVTHMNQGETRLVGSSYVKEKNGRRGATAVDPEYRGNGLGHLIVRETVVQAPYQFSEVRPANVPQCAILEKNGFRRVVDPAAVRRILGQPLSGLVVASSEDETDGSYVRVSRDAVRTERYVMYERRGQRP